MRLARGCVAAAIAAASAVSLAGLAAADPTLSGHYTRTEKTASGTVTTDVWNFAPCGSGCAKEEGGSLAHLSGAQWAMDIVNALDCPDGSKVHGAVRIHYIWDASSLAGTGQAQQIRAACGSPAGDSWTVTIQLTPAS